MFKTVEFKEYTDLSYKYGGEMYTTIHVNPETINYLYAYRKNGIEMTIIVFGGDKEVCVLGDIHDVKKALEKA